jgi:hypothetical protein
MDLKASGSDAMHGAVKQSDEIVTIASILILGFILFIMKRLRIFIPAGSR